MASHKFPFESIVPAFVRGYIVVQKKRGLSSIPHLAIAVPQHGVVCYRPLCDPNDRSPWFVGESFDDRPVGSHARVCEGCYREAKRRAEH